MHMCSRCLWFVSVEHVIRSQEVQLSTALLKHVSPTKLLSGVHQSLLHAGWIDVGVAYGSHEQCDGTSHHWGSHTSATEGAAATMEGGATDARAVGDDVRFHPTITSW